MPGPNKTDHEASLRLLMNRNGNQENPGNTESETQELIAIQNNRDIDDIIGPGVLQL